jgi:benzoate-CoA ligase
MNLFSAIFRSDVLANIAILYEHRQITYGELRDETLQMAHVLKHLGITDGDRVALLLNDSPEFIASFIAVCSSGAIAVPINMGLRIGEQIGILKDCDAHTALVEAESITSLLNEHNLVPGLRNIVGVARGEGVAETAQYNPAVRIWSFRDLVREAGLDQNKLQTDVIPFPEPRTDQAAFILYTSGSTGEPKGAVHRQSDIFYTNQTYCSEVLKLRHGDRLFSSSRLPFAYGLGNAFTFPLLNGHTTILCREKPTPQVIAKVFSEYKPTIFFGVPVVYRLLLDNLADLKLDASSLRLCISAGEALPAQLGEQWQKTFGVPVLDGIGSTEMLHMWMSNHEGEIVYGSSGKLLKGYEARLLDPDGQPCPLHTAGNLWVKGPSAAMGYWGRVETSAATFVDGWVRTGDLYREDERGIWFHMGRSDDCFKSSGQWVSPVEVEGALLRLDGISRIAVVEDFDADGLPCACAFVVKAKTPESNDELEQKLREVARSQLPRFKQPKRYVFRDELPYTATGKIQRFKLREQLRER